MYYQKLAHRLKLEGQSLSTNWKIALEKDSASYWWNLHSYLFSLSTTKGVSEEARQDVKFLAELALTHKRSAKRA